ncbi:MAG: carbon-monoxide dehydrogenase large subunit, partial [Gammaproteobacteria bacterium]
MADRFGGIGAAQLRSEDPRLLRGQGHYASDSFPPGLVHAVVLRSPHAHAHIRAIDTLHAAAMPGVLAVLTGADALADGLQPIPHDPDWQGPPDAELRLPSNFDVYSTANAPLPHQTVRYVGEAVAVVIAHTHAAAADAAEQIAIDYEVLSAVVDARIAMQPGAPQLWPHCEGNLALTCEVGDEQATTKAFEGAAHVVKFDSWVHRVTGSPMEPRAVVGEYDPQTQRYTLRAASGRGVVQTRERLAITLGVDPSQCRVVFGDM